MTDDRLPNPFIPTVDLLLEAIDRRLAADDVLPVFLDPDFLAKLENAITDAADTPARSSRAARVVARLRELAR